MQTFKPNRKFRRDYGKLFRKDPLLANTFLLLAELADENGQIRLISKTEIANLLRIRFEDPRGWAL